MSGEGGYRETRSAADGPASRPGDVAMRQLRRRYESLREDYEDLLERLSQLEQRLPPPQAPARLSGEPPSTRLGDQMQQVVSRPWFALREEYARAAQELLGLTGAMDDLAHRAFKGQRTAREPEPSEEPATQEASNGLSADEPEAEHADGQTRQRNSTIQVQVQSPSLGALLDFQEQLSRLSDVARVSMSQVNEERALLIVELEPERVESNN